MNRTGCKRCVGVQVKGPDDLEKALRLSKKSAMTLKIGKEAFYKQIDMTLSEAYDYASNVMVENMLKLDDEEGLSLIHI